MVIHLPMNAYILILSIKNYTIIYSSADGRITPTLNIIAHFYVYPLKYLLAESLHQIPKKIKIFQTYSNLTLFDEFFHSKDIKTHKQVYLIRCLFVK